MTGGNLLSGTTQSCGCLKERPRENLTGRRFGRLVVKGWIPDDDKGVIWECQCDCGGTCFTKGSWLKRGNVISCGCFSKETAKIIGNAARANSGAIEGTNVKLIQGALDGKMYATNTSGIRGVGLDRKTGKWIASISFKNKTYYLGSFDDKNDAAKVRKKAEDVMFGEFLDYYESELRADHEAEVEGLKKKYIQELRVFAKGIKNKKQED